MKAESAFKMYAHKEYFHESVSWSSVPASITPPQAPVYVQPPGITPGQILLGLGLGVAAAFAIIDLLSLTSESQRNCRVCGCAGHDRRTCPYEGQRLSFSRSIPKSNRCECCGSSRYGTQRHHTRGRSSLSDFLDVCLDCHLACCHGGHFQNLGSKPHTCRVTGNRSQWRH